MRPGSFLAPLMVGSVFVLAIAPAAAADDASCAAQFARTGARDVVPFGQVIVAPEAQNPTMGGANLGEEAAQLAQADRTACPITSP
jgi:hypothetical protein